MKEILSALRQAVQRRVAVERDIFRESVNSQVEFWKSCEALPPGEVKVVTFPATQEQFAVMHLDDFDHIMQLAGLRRGDRTSEVLQHKL